MSETIQSSKLKLHIVGPVNIGAKDKLTTKDYIYNYDAGEVYLLNQHDWFKYLHKLKVLSSFEQYLQTELIRPNGRSMYDWAVATLQKYRVTKEALGSAVKSMMHANRYVEKRKNSLNDIIPQTRCADGTVYIPGSAIKGMIDTAIIEYMVSKDTTFKQKLQSALRIVVEAYKGRDRRMQQNSIRNVERLIKSKIEILTDKNGRLMKGAVSSVFRGISVSDAMPVSSVATEILQKVDHGIDRDALNKISVWREYILPNNEFQFSITLDTTITKQIGIHNMDELLAVIERSYTQKHTMLRGVFKSIPTHVWQQGENANAYLGGNTGFLHKTIIMAAFDYDVQRGTAVVKELLNSTKAFQRHKHPIRDRIISPRMMKLTEWDHDLWEVGGVRIEPIN